MEHQKQTYQKTFEEIVVEDMYEHMNDESLERLYNENLDKYLSSEEALLRISMEMEKRNGQSS